MPPALERATEEREDISREERQERFLRLLLPVRDRLARFARGMTRTREEADDLTSDTILAALERFDHIRGPEAFLSYLFTIAVRIHRRREWRRRLFGKYDEERAAAIPASGSAPDASADVEMLHRALARLPERQREAVVLFEISGLSLEEIREIQGGSLSGVKSRVSRGRMELARLLGAVDGDARRYEPADLPAAEINGMNNAFLIYSGSRRHG